MTKKELEALVLSLQIKLQWVTSEIDKRDAIIAAQAAKIAELEDKIKVLTAQLNANSRNSKPNANRNKRFESPMPVRVFRIRWRVPKMTADNHGDISHKIRRTVDSICNERLGVPHHANNKLGHGERGVPAKPHPSHFADF